MSPPGWSPPEIADDPDAISRWSGVINLEALAGRYASTLAAHLATAITVHRRSLVDQEYPMPPGLDVLLGQLRTYAARSGQPSTPLPARDDSRDMDPALLDYPAVSRRLGVSERTVRRLVAAGALPAVRVGNAVRLHPDDLTTWIDDQRGAA